MGKILTAVGICLLVVALVLALGNVQEANAAETASDRILLRLKAATEEEDTPPPSSSPLLLPEEYCAILSIPALDLELPIRNTWSYDQLKSTPCREAGSIAGGDLVIAGHNYPGHFGNLHTLTPGTTAILTDNSGVRTYILQQVRTLNPENIDAVHQSGCSLVLYTCTVGGKNRVAAYFLEEK